MEVTRYTYQSPYTSPVQFGRAETSAQKEKEQEKTNELLTQTNQKAQEAQQFQASQMQEVKPSVELSKLDLYA